MLSTSSNPTGLTVAVVIPTYNRHELLKLCVRSVLADIATDEVLSKRIKVIVVDDGSSSDDAKKALSEIEDDYSSDLLNVLRLPTNSGGASVPRNAALDIVDSDYVFFVDSDDYLGEKAIRKLLLLLDMHHPDYIYLNSVNVGRRGDSSGVIQNGYEERDRLFALRSLVVRRVFSMLPIKKAGLRFDEFLRRGEDLLFALQFMLLAKTFGFAGGYDYYNLVEHKSAGEDSHLSRKGGGSGVSWSLRASYSVHTIKKAHVSIEASGLSMEEKDDIVGKILLPRSIKKFLMSLKKVETIEAKKSLVLDMADAVSEVLTSRNAFPVIDKKFRPFLLALIDKDVDGFLGKSF